MEERFLAALSATCNVKATCAEVGMTAASAYNHRNRWPGFAERWRAAIEEEHDRLELGLIHAACNLFSAEELPEATPITAITADHAIHLLHMRRHQVWGIGKRPGLRPREPDIEDVRAEILRKVAASSAASVWLPVSLSAARNALRRAPPNFAVTLLPPRIRGDSDMRDDGL